MKIAVTDANIFIDLIKLQMLTLLFDIGLDIQTTREIIDQLREDQLSILNPFILAGILQVHHFSDTELLEVIQFTAPRALEIADKSVAWLSIKLRAVVLTGDGPLRKFCESQKLEVKGIIWLFDTLVEKKLIVHAQAAEKMRILTGFNSRLPKETCAERIRKWMGH